MNLRKRVIESTIIAVMLTVVTAVTAVMQTASVENVQLYKSDEHRLVGGVVYEDGWHLTFVYENGELTYEEEQ